MKIELDTDAISKALAKTVCRSMDDWLSESICEDLARLSSDIIENDPQVRELATKLLIKQMQDVVK